MFDELYQLLSFFFVLMVSLYAEGQNSTTTTTTTPPSDSDSDSEVLSPEIQATLAILAVFFALLAVVAGYIQFRRSERQAERRSERSIGLDVLINDAANKRKDNCLELISKHKVTAQELSTLVCEDGYSLFHYAARDDYVKKLLDACQGLPDRLNYLSKGLNGAPKETPFEFALRTSDTPEKIIDYYAANTPALKEYITHNKSRFFQAIVDHVKDDDSLNKIFVATAQAYENSFIEVSPRYSNDFLKTALTTANKSFMDSIIDFFAVGGTKNNNSYDTIDFSTLCNQRENLTDKLPLEIAISNNEIGLGDFTRWYNHLLSHTDVGEIQNIYNQYAEQAGGNAVVQSKLVVLQSDLLERGFDARVEAHVEEEAGALVLQASIVQGTAGIYSDPPGQDETPPRGSRLAWSGAVRTFSLPRLDNDHPVDPLDGSSIPATWV